MHWLLPPRWEIGLDATNKYNIEVFCADSCYNHSTTRMSRKILVVLIGVRTLWAVTLLVVIVGEHGGGEEGLFVLVEEEENGVSTKRQEKIKIR